jgi:ubiquinone biosynthesis protein COQ4
MLPLPRYDLPRAAVALRALMRDPDDLPQVFALIESLAGTAPHRLLRRFERSASGRIIIAEQRDIVPILTDREALRRLPEGSLAHAYLAFVEREGISAEGLQAAAREGQRRKPGPFTFVRNRMRDTHDLWHAVTGYQGDVLGELALLAFLTAQHWNTAVAAIVAAGLAKGWMVKGGTSLILDAWSRGRHAEWLPAQPWEELLALPLSDVRDRLKVGPPPRYTPVRSAQLREAGIVSE